jgi:hypothetical protein
VNRAFAPDSAAHEAIRANIAHLRLTPFERTADPAHLATAQAHALTTRGGLLRREAQSDVPKTASAPKSPRIRLPDPNPMIVSQKATLVFLISATLAGNNAQGTGAKAAGATNGLYGHFHSGVHLYPA